MMQISSYGASTQPFHEVSCADEQLLARYHAIVTGEHLSWLTPHRKLRLLGTGGQGVVYLGERRGSDGFTLPMALKVFSPHSYRDADDYDEDMKRIAQVAARVALIQHDNVLDVQNFVAQDGIRIMEMEWVDGYDLRKLLTRRMLDRAEKRLGPDHWKYLNDVIVTAGPVQPRLKPGIAIQVLRECLAGLGAMHREHIVHGDLKPANIMLKRTGNAKVIDIGSAIDLRTGAGRRVWSPAYAAPEVQAGGENGPGSDLASLGYVLIEMLAGRSPFEGLTTYPELLTAKRQLEQRLPELLPREVSCNDMLLHLCRRLIAPDPARRFASAEAADLERKGAADFHRQLVKGNLASEYENDIRVWLEQLG
jgi:serine/threonine-protein kinase